MSVQQTGKYRWNNDYNQGAHPEIIKALSETNDDNFSGYGTDEWCEKARREIHKYLECPEADIHFMVGATQVNYTVISHALRPWQCAVCADSGHIEVHETGALEHAGFKCLTMPNHNGNVTAAGIRAIFKEFAESEIKEHVVQPKLVYFSLPSEFGTVYTKDELLEIRKVCDEYGAYVFIDGARLSYGLGVENSAVTLDFLAQIADVFLIGGTKCGTLFGEAVIIVNDEIKSGFRASMKQNGALLAKGWLLGMQFHTMFKDGLYFELGKKADAQAMRIRRAFEKKGIRAYIESPTNQQFVVLTQSQADALAERHIFEHEGRTEEGEPIVRFCTSWATRDEAVDALVHDIEAL